MGDLVGRARRARSAVLPLALASALVAVACAGSAGDTGRAATTAAPAAPGTVVDRDGPAGDRDRPGDVRADAADGADPVESPDPRFVVDADGRVLLLRGTNVISAAKSDPDHTGGVDRADVLALREDHGFNVARHLIFWSAIQPEPGAVDEAYLDRVAERLDWYAEAGVYVVLDMHQDIYSEVFGGDGAPAWAVITDGAGFNPPEGGPWWAAVADPAVQRAYRNFWDPALPHSADLQAAYVDAWRTVVTRFADHPAVIGYDLMNEPIFANGGLAETLAWRDAAEAGGDWRNPRLIDFTQRVIDAVREVDRDGYLFYEPTSLVNVSVGGEIGGPFPGDVVGLTDPRPGPPRLVYAPHLYDTDVHEGSAYTEEDRYVADWEALRTADRDEQGGALWIGELGGPSDAEGMEAYVTDILEMADRQLIGWAHWSYDPGSWGLTADGADTPWADWLARPAPQAVAGVPESIDYDPGTRVLRVAIRANREARGPTEVGVPRRVYPDGFAVVAATEDGAEVGGLRTTADAERQVVAVDLDAPPEAWVLCVAPTADDCG